MRIHHIDPIKNARQTMVLTQLKINGVIDQVILNAFEKIPREYFIPITSLPLAYSDNPIYCDIAGRYIFSSQVLGSLLQHLSLIKNDKVLVVGGNYGYTAAILYEMGCTPHIVESHPILIAKCREKLKRQNIIIQSSPLMEGLKMHKPYKAIIIELGLKSIPNNIIKQLEEMGKIATCIINNQSNSAKACVFEKRDGKLHEIFSMEANMPMYSETDEPEEFVF